MTGPRAKPETAHAELKRRVALVARSAEASTLLRDMPELHDAHVHKFKFCEPLPGGIGEFPDVPWAHERARYLAARLGMLKL